MLNQMTAVKNAIAAVLAGKDELVELTMIAIVNKGHLLLEDVPGTGKTVLAKSLARLIGGDFKRIQFTPDILPTDITGIQFFHPKHQEFEMRPGPVMTNILLADEINRATPRAQSSLLEVMEERQVTIDGETIKLPTPFLVMATQNPIESHGTFPLPEAQLDRFFMKLPSGYPNYDQEKQMLHMYRSKNPQDTIEPIFSLEDILLMQQEVQHIHVSDEVENYLLSIVQATRNHEFIENGVSPRGTLAFMRAAQGAAYVQGRTFVTPDDIQYVAPYVLSHRLVLTMEGTMRKTKENVLRDILESIEVPVESEAGR
ncbi:magnesium chelatase [Fictibacillus phosphorivorans]|uniref:Magnesium chelatase n=1 Tax=Fictibacillus phosphorivorans TaxID=1221500 RepID=A0A163SNY1_9BACL|nr:MoxR family ATPase [Fictibacillus phosphorivorans]KZE69499.1 magnesium chelatase [Fictibacillus phosphorivorans]